MKYELRIPTSEQYAYINCYFEGTAEDAIEEYRRLTALVTGGVGMDTKDFNKFIDELLEKGSISGDPGMTESMNIEQQTLMQAIKRSQARIKNKQK